MLDRRIPSLDEALAKLDQDNERRLMEAAEDFMASNSEQLIQQNFPTTSSGQQDPSHMQVQVRSKAYAASLLSPEADQPGAEEVRLVSDMYEVTCNSTCSGKRIKFLFVLF